MSSCSVAFLRNRCQMSMAKSVLLLLKIEVRELIKAAMITAIIRPRRPKKTIRETLLIKIVELAHSLLGPFSAWSGHLIHSKRNPLTYRHEFHYQFRVGNVWTANFSSTDFLTDCWVYTSHFIYSRKNFIVESIENNFLQMSFEVQQIQKGIYLEKELCWSCLAWQRKT